MKKIIMLLIFTIILSGCDSNSSNNLQIVTTSYPIEYITKELYEDHSIITSIYPDSINIYEHELTDKQLTNYSHSDIFIYNGLSEERLITIELLERNKNLNIIDSTYVLDYKTNIEELWLDPSNLLMMGQNIKNGLKEYIPNSFAHKEIDDNYENLKVVLSELDAELKLTAETATNKTILTASDSLKFLEKYGLTVISLDDTTELLSKDITTAKNLLSTGNINYIINIENNELNETVTSLINDYQVEVLTFKIIDNLSEEERDANENYLTLMKKNIDLLKKELYQ